MCVYEPLLHIVCVCAFVHIIKYVHVYKRAYTSSYILKHYSNDIR